MKKNIVIPRQLFAISFLLILQTGMGQVNLYSTPAKSTFQNTYISPDFNLMLKALESRQAKYDQNQEYLFGLKNWILEIRGETNDAVLNNHLTYNQSRLKQLENTDLSIATNQLKNIEFDIKESILEYNKRIEKSKTKVANGSNEIELLYQKGVDFAKIGEFDDAIQCYTQVIELSPKNPTPYYARGLANYYLGYNSLAISDFTKTLNLNPDYFPSLYYRAASYTNMERFDYAIVDLDKYIASVPDDFNGYFLRGYAEDSNGHTKEAMDDYMKVLDLNPKHSMTLNNIGYSYYNKGEYDIAMDYVDKALKYDTKNHFAWSSRAEILLILDKYEDCIIAIDYAIKLDPENGFHYLIRGRAKLKLGEKSDACDDLNTALENGEFKALEYISQECK